MKLHWKFLPFCCISQNLPSNMQIFYVTNHSNGTSEAFSLRHIWDRKAPGENFLGLTCDSLRLWKIFASWQKTHNSAHKAPSFLTNNTKFYMQVWIILFRMLFAPSYLKVSEMDAEELSSIIFYATTKPSRLARIRLQTLFTNLNISARPQFSTFFHVPDPEVCR